MAEESITIWAPLGYAAFIVAAFVIFSKRHHKWKMQKFADTPQFYRYNFPQEIYQQLLTKEKVPPKLLRSALIAWGIEDFTRILKFRDNEPAVNSLLQGGFIADGVHERFAGSKVLNEKELSEILGEVSNNSPNWSQYFMLTVTEATQQHAIRRRFAQLDKFKREFYEMVGNQEGASPSKPQIEEDTSKGTQQNQPRSLAKEVEAKKFRK